MQSFQTVDLSTFRYNGLKYSKNFMIIPQGATNLGIYNAFDTSFQLIPSAHFSEILIDGVPFSSQTACIDVLTPLIFYKPAGGIGTTNSPSFSGTSTFYPSYQQQENDIIKVKYDNGSDVVTIDRYGYITANRFELLGGSGTNFLMADGSVNSSEYALRNSYSGTAGRITKFSATGIDSSQIFESAGCVFVGTGSGSYTAPFEVFGLAKATGFIGNLTGNTVGNSTTASKLLTPRTINSVPFDGSANISLSAFNSISVSGVSSFYPAYQQADNNILKIKYDDGSDVITFDRYGYIKANRFELLGGSGTNFLMADGSVSSNEYALRNSYSGTAGRITKFSAAGIDASQIFESAGCVFVGTGSGSYTAPFEVLGLAKASGFIGNLTGNTVGNSSTTTKLLTARTINGVSFDGSSNITINAVDSTARIASSEKGVANGVATLDASGLILTTQLPSYVDDVLEYANLASFPATGTSGKIYVDIATNKTYRWSGSAYIYITSGSVDSVAGKTGVVTLVKADVGLSNVDDTSDVNKPVSTAQSTAINAKVTDAITNGVTTVAPSQNAVFDALALKATIASPTFTGVLTSPLNNAPLPAATASSGEIVYFGTGTLTAGVLYYLNTSLVWTAANASAAASATGMLGIALGTSPSNGLLIRGFARYGGTPYTSMAAGQIQYVSTTAGEFTGTPPTATANIVRVIGYCVDVATDIMYFSPDNTWVELL